ncbi:MFS general substrate transporter [Penicillium paradoxum]|uniref:MFS general substrate transporter n=1 Tax=Penicillium paradoxum TaxID=176176 RepID=UPI0025484668|nr:MFS general substrate transporter [Penicillium paradoxum]KAJ5783018.1 MFS general substrate transporter [Penicillium paradoxum]
MKSNAEIRSEEEIVHEVETVPGTELLFDSDGPSSQLYGHLQHIERKGRRILLVPQPSRTDPNDPLSWSRMKKGIIFANACLYSFLGGVTGPIIAAGVLQLTQQYNASFQKVNIAVAANLICTGVGCFYWMPFFAKFGRRPTYLITTVLMCACLIWQGFATRGSYTSFLVARVVMGLGQSPIYSIAPTTIADIYFLHHQGAKIAFYGLSVLLAAQIGPMLSSFIIQSLGPAWSFWILAMCLGANMLTLIFAMPETMYYGDRAAIVPAEAKSGSEHVEDVGAVHTVEKRSYMSELSLWPGGNPDVDLRAIFFRPFLYCLNPIVIWASLVYGMSFISLTTLAATAAQIFGLEPYNFDSIDQGLVFLSPFVGSLTATFFCSYVVDKIVNYSAQRNGGVREPEMRLFSLLVAAGITAVGSVIVALCLHYRVHYMGPIVGFGIITVSNQIGANMGMSYPLDCYPKHSAEVMVSVTFLRSVVTYIWNWFINDWLEACGPLIVFLSMGAIQIAIQLSCLGFLKWGKRLRVALFKRHILGAWVLEYCSHESSLVTGASVVYGGSR